MEVETIEFQDDPEELVCKAARGDYYDGFVEDVSFTELMRGVEYDDTHKSEVNELMGEVDSETEYKKYALLERLFRRGHFGPFEHAQIVVGVEGVSRSCMAQITRHRHASFDVQSQRYVDFREKDDPITTPKSLVDEEHFTRGEGEIDVEGREELLEQYEDTKNELVDMYGEMVDAGVPKEDARFILPIGTKVNFTMSVNARMLLHIEDMRNKANAQWEIRKMTQLIHDEFEEWMPMTAHLYEKHGPHPITP